MSKKTAVVLIHGIGEQVPMETLKGFVDAVWTQVPDLVFQDKAGFYRPAAEENAASEPKDASRRQNRFWVKPDPRNRYFDLNRITTESTRSGRRIDFFEYYWAHRTSNSRWDQVKSWLIDLLFRKPWKGATGRRVPPSLLPTWIALWVLTIVALFVTGALAWLSKAGFENVSNWVPALVVAIVSAGLARVVSLITAYAGDVVRYVKAKPENIITRQNIREDGVAMLERLMCLGDEYKDLKPEYDRIIVVGHSLGTIVGYDMLTHCFGRHNKDVIGKVDADTTQPKRAQLEQIVRDGMESGFSSEWLERYRAAQDNARIEMIDNGGRWTISDFISIGSPLTHAEFLMARDKASLEAAKLRRELPTCPPAMEYDTKTKDAHLHFSYRASWIENYGDSADPLAPRWPHHGSVFAFTKWTNIYSQQRQIIYGDLISGEVSEPFGQQFDPNFPLGQAGITPNDPLSGIDEIPVLCEEVKQRASENDKPTPEDVRKRVFTHLSYWKLWGHTINTEDPAPYHIRKLRNALDLDAGQKPRKRRAAQSD